MPATMVTRVLTIGRYGRFRTNYVTLPLTPSLLIEQETPQRYFVLPDEDAPVPEPASRPGAPRKPFTRNFRNIGEPLLE